MPAVERLLQLEIPPMAQWMRVLLCELGRVSSHLTWFGTHALDLGAMSVYFYCFREREEILKIFEMFSGQRMMTSYIRIGGLALEPPRGWQKVVANAIGSVGKGIEEYHNLLSSNPILCQSDKGRGRLPVELMLDLGVTGPMTRAGGIKMDARKDTRIAATKSSISKCRPEPKTMCTLVMSAHGRDAAEPAHRETSFGRHAVRPVASRRPARAPAATGKDEDSNGVSHLSFQDCDRRLPRSGRLDLPSSRVAARRIRLLRGERWHRETT